MKVQKSHWWDSQVKFSQFKWIVNYGSKILFWEGWWIDDSTLQEKFSRLYNLSRWKHIKVCHFLELCQCYDHCNDAFWCITLRSWEEWNVKELKKLLKSVSLMDKEDVLLWLPSGEPYSSQHGVLISQQLQPHHNMNWFF